MFVYANRLHKLTPSDGALRIFTGLKPQVKKFFSGGNPYLPDPRGKVHFA